jgi:hypothetical protein
MYYRTYLKFIALASLLLCCVLQGNAQEVAADTIYKPAFMPTFTPYVPVIDPSRVTCDNLKTNILGGVNEL